jgi:hypothetical protein
MIVHGIHVAGKSNVEFVYNGDEVIINILHNEIAGIDNTVVDTDELIKVLSLITTSHKEFKNGIRPFKEKVKTIKILLGSYNFIVDGGSIDNDVAYDAFTTNLLLLIDKWNTEK